MRARDLWDEPRNAG